MSRREAGTYSAEYVHEVQTTINRDHDARHKAYKVESDALAERNARDIATHKDKIQKLQHELATKAIGIEPSGTQADFIRQLRGEVFDLTGERAKYQRLADDNASQRRAADDLARKVTAAHHQSQAEARHENDALRSNVSALTDAQQQPLHERGALASKVTQLQVEASTSNAGHEHSTRACLTKVKHKQFPNSTSRSKTLRLR